jgi:transcriptional regulator with PAS, ATPase and Fis domain
MKHIRPLAAPFGAGKSSRRRFIMEQSPNGNGNLYEGFFNSPVLENILRIAPLLLKLIEGRVGITITSKDRWLAYVHEDAQINIKVGNLLPYESVSAKCIRDNRLVVQKNGSEVLGSCYIGRAVPVNDANGEIIGSFGYLKIVDEQEYIDNIIIGRNENMQRTYRQILKAAEADTDVMLLGETGTGKDLFARLIHKQSVRKDKPFVVVNCSAIPESLFESEMFGYEKGAFTGAKDSGKKGLFELANEGILFLDEIGDLDINLQTKLLRALQSKKILRLGANKEIDIDIRVITATHRNLEESIIAKAFRSDLYFRLSSMVIRIPSLRERKEDLPMFIDRILANKTKQFGKKPFSVSANLYKKLLEYDYPGNIRELENIIQRGVIMADGDTIEEAEVKDVLHLNSYGHKDNIETPEGITAMERIEKQTITKALMSLKNKKIAAEYLGISRDTLYRKIKKYHISRQ